MRKIDANVNIHMRQFGNCFPDVKCYSFNNNATIIAQICIAHLWFDSTKTSMNKHKIACNNNPRRFLGIPEYNSAS